MENSEMCEMLCQMNTTLNAIHKILLDKFEIKEDKKMTGYNLFTAEQMKTLLKEERSFGNISDKWGHLTPEQREEWNTKAKAACPLKVPEEKEKKLSGYNLFTIEKMKDESVPAEKRLKHTADLWKRLSAVEKTEWNLKARPDEGQEEPQKQKRPMTGYNLFTIEKMKDESVPSKDKLKHIAALWNKLSAEDKEAWKKHAHSDVPAPAQPAPVPPTAQPAPEPVPTTSTPVLKQLLVKTNKV